MGWVGLGRVVSSLDFSISRGLVGWLRGAVVERLYLAVALSLSCIRPAADG